MMLFFYGCQNLTTINNMNFETLAVTNMTSMVPRLQLADAPFGG